MRLVTFICVFLASLILVKPSQAQVNCDPIITVFYFGNGVGRGFSTFGDAVHGLNSLRSAINSVLSTDDQRKNSYKLAFNRSDGRLADIVEAARQTLGNEWPTLLIAFFLNDTRIINLLPDDVVQRFNDFLNNQAIQEMIAGNSSNSDVSNQVASYNSDIQEGKKIVLVAHSQGNIFANLAFQQITAPENQSFTIVPVASPESFMRSNLVGHVRFLDDLVIGGVMAAKLLVNLPPPLPANDQDNVDIDILSHSFVDSYLADPSSRLFIINGALNSSDLLPAPVAASGQGAITVTLTWGSNPDVDLHAFEPTGVHVYYANLRGQFGFLDVDDVTSFGPEHYYLSCQALRDNNLAVGRYRFGVNYFFGFSPEVATLTVKTPSSESTFSKTLNVSVGSSGNSNPVPVADVIISKNPNTDVFSFVIEPK